MADNAKQAAGLDIPNVVTFIEVAEKKAQEIRPLSLHEWGTSQALSPVDEQEL